MYLIKQGIIFFSVTLLAVHVQLSAAEHEHEQHEAHVHGEAQLLIAQEDDILEIEFHSPAMNIVGFEHQPKTTSQREAIEAAIVALKRPDLLFRLPSAAKCQSMTTEVESPRYDHAHEDEHEHSHADEAHSDFTAHYHYRCDEITQLESIEIELMNRFPGTEHLEVQSISPKGQQKIDLTPGHTTLEL
ncbi:MAG: DUF2796 domain-containing protein [Candidatus Thiodiazotropha sp. (ex Myrtea sp. 'scaly one' KF741663)]|nr:DUF2796 domain-containing protein [Candidatus Thiodiazotropha sp. (ex Myrtea sp. 'scaly one' KF741663)]